MIFSASATAAPRLVPGALNDGELVPAEPGDEIAGTDERRDDAGSLHEHVVSDGVAEGVVDALEPVEIDEEQGGPRSLVIAVGDGLGQPAVELQPVGEFREVIVLGVVADQILGATQRGNVGNAADDQTRSRLELDALLARDDRPDDAFAIGEGLLVLVDLAGFENELVVGAKDFSLLFRDEIGVRAADELLVGPPK